MKKAQLLLIPLLVWLPLFVAMASLFWAIFLGEVLNG